MWRASSIASVLLAAVGQLVAAGNDGFMAPRKLEEVGIIPWWGSCLQPDAPKTPIPLNVSQNGNQHHVVQECAYQVSWEFSDFLVGVLEKKSVDLEHAKKDLTFRACWDVSSDAEARHFPWVHTTTYDWRYDLMHQGSVTLNPQDLTGSEWIKGIQQVLPDALDYFARMGEIDYRIQGAPGKRKIIPKFMLYGWSKGASMNFHMGRWRPDVVQGSVVVHGCNHKYRYDKTNDKQGTAEGQSPTLWFSSENDWKKCSHKQTWKQYTRALKKTSSNFPGAQRHVMTPCGHHPDQCWSVCNLEEIFYTPFWDFVDFAYEHQSCYRWTHKSACKRNLCQWDAAISTCTEAHPTKLVPSCQSFCDLELVNSCSDVDVAKCTSSYSVMSVEAAKARGMHAHCEVVGGQCQQAPDAFQCFFQDQC